MKDARRSPAQAAGEERSARPSDEAFEPVADNAPGHDWLGAAMSATSDGVMLVDEERLLFANRSAAAMFGYGEPSEIVGCRWRDFFTIDQQRHLRHHVLPDYEASGAFRGDIAATDRNGRTVDAEITLTRVEGRGTLVIGRDNSERRRLERQRKQLLKTLFFAEREQAVSHFAAKVAHDFNNVMAVIMGSALLMRRSLGDNAEAVQYADRIAEACGQANVMLTELTNSSTQTADATPVDLREALQEAADLLRTAVGPRVVLLVSLPDRPILAEARGTAFSEVALTLVTNAGDMLPGGKGRIELALSELSGEAAAAGAAPAVGAIVAGLRYGRLTVSDTGSGLPAEQAEHLFDAFFTSKDEAGDMLGLAIVARLVDAAGGAIRVGQRPGEGSIFEVFWPLHDHAPALERPAAATDLDGRTILVVDDEEAIAQLVAKALEHAGAAVGVCTDPREALAAIDDDPAAWSLLVTDYDMPGLDGAELTRRARALRAGLPVLLCTAVTAALRGPQMDRGLFDGIVAKPFTPGELVDAAAAAIVRHKDNA